ncbi:MAG: hypothetical protein ACOC22_02020 [bacterium]
MLFEEFRTNKKNQSVYLNEQSPDKEEEEKEEDNEEIKPIKKYYLLQQLYDLKQKLTDHGLHNSDLNLIIKFSNELSYETILKLSEKVTDIVQKQVDQRGRNNDKKLSK